MLRSPFRLYGGCLTLRHRHPNRLPWASRRVVDASIVGEPLEPRQMLTTLTAWSTELVMGAERTPAEEENRETGIGFCREHLANPTGTQSLPAPLAADFDLNGRFTSGDFVAFFRQADRVNLAEQAFATYELAADLDLLESMQWIAYGAEHTPDWSGPCVGYELATGDSSAKFSTTDDYHEDQETLRKSTLRVGDQHAARLRASLYFDEDGDLQTSTLGLYRATSALIYSRLQSEYDASGRIQNQTTWVFDELGSVRRITQTSFFYVRGAAYRATEVEYRDASGQATSRRIHYFDNQAHEIAVEDYAYQGGVVSAVNQTRFEVGGRERPEAESPDGATWSSGNAPRASEWSYLVETHDAYAATMDGVEPYYRDVLRMNSLPSQLNLNSILETLLREGRLSASEAERYRRLNQYFELARDVAEAVQGNEHAEIYTKYAELIDSKTGDWKAAFRTFADAEGLTLPLAPLRIAADPHQVPEEQLDELTADYQQLLGDYPFAYFHTVVRDAPGHVRELLESMRQVKASIKLLEYQAHDTFPLFDRIRSSDQPDNESLGLQPIVLLTGWYFFETREDGSYRNDRVNEEILRQRVLTSMTNEDVFYAMNLEQWELVGPPAVVSASLRKLKRVADLIHHYNPNLLIGYYRLLPRRDPNSANAGPDSLLYESWQKHNDRIAAELADSVDVLFPSLYVLHLSDDSQTTEQRWNVFGREMIKESRRIGGEKPVIAFAALYYHPNGMNPETQRSNNAKGWQFIEPEFLLYQLTLLGTLADGAVMYYDLRKSWSDLEETGLVEAIELFQQVKQHGAVEELRGFYEELVTQHHDELLEKTELETQLIERRQELEEAVTQRDGRLTVVLTREIALLEYELGNKISLWPIVKQFIQRRLRG